MASPAERWRALDPVLRGLLVFVPVVCLGINLALPHLPWQPQLITTLDYTQTWLDRTAHHDSWLPMRLGLAYLDDPGDKALYQEIFFERGVKLQYPPTSLLPLDALRRLPGRLTSDPILNGLSWLALLATVVASAGILVFSLRQRCPRPVDRILLAGTALVVGFTFYPLVRGYYLGQIQTWIDMLVAAMLLCWILGWRATSGIFGGLICAIKPQLGLLVLWALLRGRWRFAAGWATAVAIVGTVSLAAYGLAPHLDYLNVLSFIGSHGEGFHPNQSLNGLLNRMLGLGNNLEWETSLFAPPDARVYWATVSTSVALIALALFWRRREHGAAPATDLAILIVTATIASPVAWTHHYAVLLPVFALALPATVATPGLGPRGIALLATAFCLVANNYRALNRLADSPLNFLQSYVFFGGLLLLVHLYRVRAAQANAR